ncbi:membrane protein insertase YidC [Chiayiivirga flava]|uniref:Membrane protein insertase YidC n=1 Tax=Chiayiivirga flava TaxID=659595 RepID=A0A7W8FZ11_9GAMM|nr:membrane protein insertase YidC [Chiayiivirga flava]MBB5207696.1 YidC/Oxa1 family membrane protein insertase [Chiayiivirga flava]
MTQTRTFLLIAWLIVAFFLWDAWQRDYLQTPPSIEAPAAPAPALDTGDGAVPAIPTDAPAATPGVSAVPDALPEAPPASRVILSNDVLRLTLDARGGTILAADLLDYPQSTEAGSPPVQLMSQDPAHFFVAQSGWVGPRAAPNHQTAFQPQGGDATLADGADTVEQTFVWTDASGVSVQRTYRLARLSYVVEVIDAVRNAGSDTWRANPYHQLLRVQPPSKGGGFTNPESYSFVGAAWYSPQDKFEKLKFADYDPAQPLKKDVTGGWLSMLQHYFAAAWIPPVDQPTQFSTAIVDGTRYLVRALGPTVELAPGANIAQTTRLYAGPKLPDVLDATAPGFGLTLDYGIFTVIAQPLHWLLAQLHKLTGNWGWAIVLLVVLIKLALFKLSEAQYKSFANMRRVQPRIEALKERYGDDRQKFQMAMMELYKKEKINPMGGCLPMLPQIPIFMGLYWVLLESVELRQAPWFGWIQNLTAPDPYFILPILNMATMYLTQKLSPTVGMDPMQKKMMTIMPLVMSAMFVFFPAGLVLYWTTNGALGLLQQWIIIRRNAPVASTPAKA